MHAGGQFATWLRKLHSGPGGGGTLVCFPPGGGSATSYRALAKHLGADNTAVYGVQYPGRQDRLGDPLIASIPELAEHVAAALNPLLGGELALFGHSMGATVAFETACRLQQQGHRLTALFVSGRNAPTIPDTSELHRGPDADLIGELERLANDPEPVAVLRADPDLAALVLPALRSDYQAVETYRYQPTAPLGCDIVALVGDADPTTNHVNMTEWSARTTAAFTLHHFPGRHFYLDEDPAAVAKTLTQYFP